MRIVTWNIHRCIGLDGAYRPERIVKILRCFDADIIALQEVDSSLLVTAELDQLEYISRGLNLDAVMGPTMKSDYGSYGNAVLTKHEILDWEEYDLSFRRFEPRGALAVTLNRFGKDIRFLNTHLGLKYWERSFQVDRLLSEFVWAGNSMTIVAGDFNEWFPWTNNNLRLERSFAWHSQRAATFPSHWPRFALDRVFIYGESVEKARSQVHSSHAIRRASDHLPLVVDLNL